METRTKKKDKRPNIYDLVGGAKELLQSELPTLRQCLQYSLLLDERSVTTLTNRKKFQQVNIAIRNIWLSVNPLLVLQSEKYTLDRLLKEYDSAQKAAPAKKSSSAFQSDFLCRMDKLFDILKCKCEIHSCVDFSCNGCPAGAHITCSCPAPMKIPTMELKFMMLQRDKVGITSTIQIGTVDKRESKRVDKLLKRKADLEEAENLKRAQLHQPTTSSQLSSDSDDIVAALSSQSEYDSSDSAAAASSLSYNFMDVSKISAAAIRYGVSNRATAAIGTATLVAAKDAKLLKDEIRDEIIIDKNKIRRAKQKHMNDARELSSMQLQNSDITGILFDGRKDCTKLLTRGDDGKLHPSEVLEEHYSICGEPGGEYLTHLTLDGDDRGTMKPAEHLASLIHEWLCDNNLSDRLNAIGGDSTNVNTGWKGGAITNLEKLLGRKLIWLICALHTNELPLRHLMVKLDGKTISNNKFDGPIGKCIPKVLELPVLEQIPPIDIQIDLIEMTDDILNDLSGDQKYLYDIVSAIKSQQMPIDLRCRKIGPHNHARWLNLANRLCRLWCSDHKLDTHNTHKLKQLVQFVVAVYAPMWFLIKRDNKWYHGPGHVLRQLVLIRQLDPGIQELVTPHIKKNSMERTQRASSASDAGQ